MRLYAPIIALTVLGLASCGEDQTARAPDDAKSAPPAETTQAPPVTSQPTTPPTTTGTGTADAQSKAGRDVAALKQYLGKPYAAGPVSLQLEQDNTFVMNEVDGNRKVEGRYALQDDTLTLSDPKGDVGPAKFPMRCRFEPLGADFRLSDSSGSCERFKGLTFTPSAG